MKRIFKRITSLLIVFAIMFGLTPLSGFVGLELPEINLCKADAASEEFTSGYYTYTVDENGYATITDCDESISGDVVIPSTLEGHPVTSIGSHAFYDCGSLTSITIPDSVTSIGSHAFDVCNSLEDVYYTGDIAGWCAIDFFDSSSNPIYYAENLYINGVLIKELVIPDSVTNIGDNAFHNCDSLKIATIGKNVTQIGNYAFCNCTNTKIACYANSTAHRFAIDNDIEVELLQNEYKVSWIVEGDATYQICEVGEKLVAPANPSKNGYRFVGWTPAVPSTMPAYDLTFTAVFEASGPVKADVINSPTQTTVSYGDAIILHIDESKVPADGRVEWTASNGNFDFVVSSDGTACKITPASSGDTTFTATVYDAEDNAVSYDEQEMTSKAGFFQKIIAFFKKLFGLTKTFEQVFRTHQ